MRTPRSAAAAQLAAGVVLGWRWLPHKATEAVLSIPVHPPFEGSQRHAISSCQPCQTDAVLQMWTQQPKPIQRLPARLLTHPGHLGRLSHRYECHRTEPLDLPSIIGQQARHKSIKVTPRNFPVSASGLETGHGPAQPDRRPAGSILTRLSALRSRAQSCSRHTRISAGGCNGRHAGVPRQVGRVPAARDPAAARAFCGVRTAADLRARHQLPRLGALCRETGSNRGRMPAIARPMATLSIRQVQRRRSLPISAGRSCGCWSSTTRGTSRTFRRSGQSAAGWSR
jgi:hypothetical protein